MKKYGFCNSSFEDMEQALPITFVEPSWGSLVLVCSSTPNWEAYICEKQSNPKA